jgi:hypothetical protein
VVHGVAAGDAIFLSWQGGSSTASVAARYPEEPSDGFYVPDVALLTVLTAEHPCVPLDDDVNIGDSVYAWGFTALGPYGESLTARIEGERWEREDALGHFIKFKQGHVTAGLSGAPLLNVRTGRVCGLVKRSRDTESDLGGLGISVSVIFACAPNVLEWQKRGDVAEYLAAWRVGPAVLDAVNEAKDVAHQKAWTEHYEARLEEAGVLQGGLEPTGASAIERDITFQQLSRIYAEAIAAFPEKSRAYHAYLHCCFTYNRYLGASSTERLEVTATALDLGRKLVELEPEARYLKSDLAFALFYFAEARHGTILAECDETSEGRILLRQALKGETDDELHKSRLEALFQVLRADYFNNADNVTARRSVLRDIDQLLSEENTIRPRSWDMRFRAIDIALYVVTESKLSEKRRLMERVGVDLTRLRDDLESERTASASDVSELLEQWKLVTLKSMRHMVRTFSDDELRDPDKFAPAATNAFRRLMADFSGSAGVSNFSDFNWFFRRFSTDRVKPLKWGFAEDSEQ